MRYSILCLAAVAGCASAVTSSPGAGASAHATESGVFVKLSEEPQNVSVSIDAPAEKVWSVLPRVYEQLGIKPEFADDAAMTIGTRSFTASRLDGKRASESVRCANQGSGPSSGMFRTRLSIATRVVSVQGKAEIISEVTGTATSVEGTSTGAVTCASTGMIEARIRELTLAALAPG
jgi:hypothetical protein